LFAPAPAAGRHLADLPGEGIQGGGFQGKRARLGTRDGRSRCPCTRRYRGPSCAAARRPGGERGSFRRFRASRRRRS
jgi:hypothetical protein